MAIPEGHVSQSPGKRKYEWYCFYPCGDLNMLGPGNGTIMRCSLAGVDVALLQEVCHFTGGQ